MNNGFLSKVYKWLAIGLLITFGCGYLLSLDVELFASIIGAYGLFAIIEIVLGLVMIFALHKLSDTVVKTLYLIYTAITGITFGSIFLYYQMSSIIFVFLATAVIFGVLGYVGKNTKLNLNGFATFLLVALLGSLVLTLINVFVKSAAIDLGTSIAILLIFCGYIVVDIWRISRMNGEQEEKYAVFWAFQLYLDIINVIIKLLQLFGKRD